MTLSDYLTWHKNIPFKVCFILWRAFQVKLPTNEKITLFSMIIPFIFVVIARVPTPLIIALVVDIMLETCGLISRILLALNITLLLSKHLLRDGGFASIAMMFINSFFTPPQFSSIATYGKTNMRLGMVGERNSNLTRVKFVIFKDISNLLRVSFPYIQWPSNSRFIELLLIRNAHRI